MIYSKDYVILKNESGFLDDDTLEELKSLTTVNGCSYKDLVYKKDGTVDEEASRRVEIKFRLKDQEMIEEMNDILHPQEESEGQ